MPNQSPTSDGQNVMGALQFYRDVNGVAQPVPGGSVDSPFIAASPAGPASTASLWSYAAAASGIVNTTTAVPIKAAAAAGIKNYIGSIQFDWEALGAATEVVISSGAGGTVIYRFKIGTGAAGSRFVTFEAPLSSAAATLLEVATLTASVTGALYVNAQGWTGA